MRREAGDRKRRSGGKKEESMSIKHRLSDERIEPIYGFHADRKIKARGRHVARLENWANGQEMSTLDRRVWIASFLQLRLLPRVLALTLRRYWIDPSAIRRLLRRYPQPHRSVEIRTLRFYRLSLPLSVSLSLSISHCHFSLPPLLKATAVRCVSHADSPLSRINPKRLAEDSNRVDGAKRADTADLPFRRRNDARVKESRSRGR